MAVTSATAHAERSWTNCSSTPPLKPGPSSAKGSRSRRFYSRWPYAEFEKNKGHVEEAYLQALEFVGDAGYTKGPVTAWGISDAFRDAALCSTALEQWFSGIRPFDEAMADYQQQRDEHSLPMFGVTCGFATLEPPPPDMQHLLGATTANQDAQDQFVSMMAGTLPVTAFFAPANVGRIMAANARVE